MEKLKKLLSDWTEKSQDSTISDGDRVVYMLCAKNLHEGIPVQIEDLLTILRQTICSLNYGGFRGRAKDEELMVMMRDILTKTIGGE
jgi:hypothetical protein